MSYKATIFQNRFDNKTHKQMSFDSWDDFARFLLSLSKIPETKKTAGLISPAIYTKDTTRSNDNVEYWGKWAAVDIDDTKGGTLDDIMYALHSKIMHHNFVCYSTASNTHEAPKFRIVFDLSRRIEKDEIRHFWHALNTELGEIGDRQTKDLSRMYYVPASYINAHNFIFNNPGDPIDPDYLKAKHPYKEKESKNFLDRLPSKLQDAVIEHRKQALDNVSIYWSSYHNCPFWPKRLATEYKTISETGWYHKMYQIMVAIAGNAIKNDYPITAKQIAELCRQFDNENGMWYTNRPLEKEADRAVEYAYRNF